MKIAIESSHHTLPDQKNHQLDGHRNVAQIVNKEAHREEDHNSDPNASYFI